MKEGERIAVLALSRCDEREVGADCLRTGKRAVAEAYFAKDDRETERLLGMVIGGFHAIHIEESKNAVGIALRIDEPLPEILGIGIVQWMTADIVEFAL